MEEDKYVERSKVDDIIGGLEEITLDPIGYKPITQINPKTKKFTKFKLICEIAYVPIEFPIGWHQYMGICIQEI